MTLDDQLRGVLNEEAERRSGTLPDVQGLISGGKSRRRRRNTVWAAGAVLAAVVAGGGVYSVAQVSGDDGSVRQITNPPTPSPLPDAAGLVEVGAGTYVVPADVQHVAAAFTLTVPAGWEAQHGNIVGKHQEDGAGAGHGPGAIGIEPFVLDMIQLTGDTCTGPETLGKPQTSVASLVAGLRAQGSGLRVSDPVAATVGGLPATRIDLDYPGSRPLKNCRLSDNIPGLEKGVLQVWSGYLVLFPAESVSVYVVDVAGRKQLFVSRVADGASAADRDELQSILDSISFDPATE